MLKRVYLLTAVALLGAVISLNGQKNAEVVVKLAEQAIVCDTDLKVELLAVVEDSRCPEGVDCVHAGNAVVRVKVTSRMGEPQIFTFNTMQGDETFEFEGYVFSLVALDPYPKEGVELRKEDYTARMKVVKKPE